MPEGGKDARLVANLPQSGAELSLGQACCAQPLSISRAAVRSAEGRRGPDAGATAQACSLRRGGVKSAEPLWIPAQRTPAPWGGKQKFYHCGASITGRVAPPVGPHKDQMVARVRFQREHSAPAWPSVGFDQISPVASTNIITGTPRTSRVVLYDTESAPAMRGSEVLLTSACSIVPPSCLKKACAKAVSHIRAGSRIKRGPFIGGERAGEYPAQRSSVHTRKCTLGRPSIRNRGG